MTRQMADDEVLRPCPWCGVALKAVTVSEGTSFRWRKVDGCCADGPEVRHDTTADDQESAEADSRRRARAAWNDQRAVAALQAERDALRAEEESSAALIQRQSDLLTGAVNVLRGDPPSDTLWSHHDVAELARATKERAERAESALEALRGQVDGLAHVATLLLELATSGECDTLTHEEVADLRKLAALLAIKERMECVT